MTYYLKIPKGTHVKNHFACSPGLPCSPTPMELGRDFVVAYHVSGMTQEQAILNMARSPFETHPENVVVMTEQQYKDHMADCEAEG